MRIWLISVCLFCTFNTSVPHLRAPVPARLCPQLQVTHPVSPPNHPILLHCQVSHQPRHRYRHNLHHLQLHLQLQVHNLLQSPPLVLHQAHLCQVSFVIHHIIHLNSPSFLICFSLASPSNVPSLEPSSQPSSQPSSEPSSQPTSSVHIELAYLTMLL